MPLRYGGGGCDDTTYFFVLLNRMVEKLLLLMRSSPSISERCNINYLCQMSAIAKRAKCNSWSERVRLWVELEVKLSLLCSSPYRPAQLK